VVDDVPLVLFVDDEEGASCVDDDNGSVNDDFATVLRALSINRKPASEVAVSSNRSSCGICHNCMSSYNNDGERFHMDKQSIVPGHAGNGMRNISW
jgi:D-arabinose 1-dehydrogenase-like Zn-dependent alcohol dehydrogenase